MLATRAFARLTYLESCYSLQNAECAAASCVAQCVLGVDGRSAGLLKPTRHAFTESASVSAVTARYAAASGVQTSVTRMRKRCSPNVDFCSDYGGWDGVSP